MAAWPSEVCMISVSASYAKLPTRAAFPASASCMVRSPKASSAVLRSVISRVRPLIRKSLPVPSNSPLAVSSSQTWRPSQPRKRKFRTYEGLLRDQLACLRLEGIAIVGVDPLEEFVAHTGRSTLAISKNASRIVAAPRLACDCIPFEGHYLAGQQSIGQAGLVLLECSFRHLALRDVDVCTDEAWCRSIVIIGYEVA